jgi:hypothetical protein
MDRINEVAVRTVTFLFSTARGQYDPRQTAEVAQEMLKEGICSLIAQLEYYQESLDADTESRQRRSDWDEQAQDWPYEDDGRSGAESVASNKDDIPMTRGQTPAIELNVIVPGVGRAGAAPPKPAALICARRTFTAQGAYDAEKAENEERLTSVQAQRRSETALLNMTRRQTRPTTEAEGLAYDVDIRHLVSQVNDLTIQENLLAEHIEEQDEVQKCLSTNVRIPDDRPPQADRKFDYRSLTSVCLRFGGEQDAVRLDFREAWQKLLVYGEAMQYSHEDYKHALRILATGQAAEFLNKNEALSLTDMVTSLKDLFMERDSLHDRLARLKTFTRRAGENLSGAVVRFKSLITDTEIMFPKDERKTREEMLIRDLVDKITSPQARAKMAKRNEKASRGGRRLTVDELISECTSFERNNEPQYEIAYGSHHMPGLELNTTVPGTPLNRQVEERRRSRERTARSSSRQDAAAASAQSGRSPGSQSSPLDLSQGSRPMAEKTSSAKRRRIGEGDAGQARNIANLALKSQQSSYQSNNSSRSARRPDNRRQDNRRQDTAGRTPYYRDNDRDANRGHSRFDDYDRNRENRERRLPPRTSTPRPSSERNSNYERSRYERSRNERSYDRNSYRDRDDDRSRSRRDDRRSSPRQGDSYRGSTPYVRRSSYPAQSNDTRSSPPRDSSRGRNDLEDSRTRQSRQGHEEDRRREREERERYHATYPSPRSYAEATSGKRHFSPSRESRPASLPPASQDVHYGDNEQWQKVEPRKKWNNRIRTNSGPSRPTGASSYDQRSPGEKHPIRKKQKIETATDDSYITSSHELTVEPRKNKRAREWKEFKSMKRQNKQDNRSHPSPSPTPKLYCYICRSDAPHDWAVCGQREEDGTLEALGNQ